MAKLDLNKDGIIQAREVYQTMTGLTKEMEDLIMQLLDETDIDPQNMNFPDFLIFVCQRRRKTCPKNSNPIRQLFEVSFTINFYELNCISLERKCVREAPSVGNVIIA